MRRRVYCRAPGEPELQPVRIFLLIVLTLWLATCGQKGPLELPAPDSEGPARTLP